MSPEKQIVISRGSGVGVDVACEFSVFVGNGAAVGLHVGVGTTVGLHVGVGTTVGLHVGVGTTVGLLIVGNGTEVCTTTGVTVKASVSTVFPASLLFS